MKTVQFKATLELAGKTATGIEVPEAVVTSLGSSKRPAVRVTIKGYTYRSTIASMGGRYMVGVNAENREAAGVAAGDELEVDIELDTEAREVTVPPQVAQFLEGDAAAKQFFEGLSYSRKRLFTVPIEQAKTPETLQRRLDKALDALREGRLP
ncbi:MAG: hypothetical protein JWL57_2887 [Actinobacteria bacterium]|nr:hypothetical protein [Actinomycetota bacterium]MEA2589614.1 hypothetical protein [Actinomycetota bacterium]